MAIFDMKTLNFDIISHVKPKIGQILTFKTKLLTFSHENQFLTLKNQNFDLKNQCFD